MKCGSPVIYSISKYSTDLTTAGGPVHLTVRNMGYGRYMSQVVVGATYNNLNNSYVASDCYVHFNGSLVTCTAPEGVGRGHRWIVSINGVPGPQTNGTIITNYKGPVLYDIFSEFNKTKSSDSAGGDVFNVTGDNFGPLTEVAVWWVRYAPLEHPNIYFDANCTLIVAHHIMRCITGPQAGGNLRWLINVAGQVSVIPSTTTQYPVIYAVKPLLVGTGLSVVSGNVVGAVPVRLAGHDADPLASSQGLATSGGGIVTLYGMYVSESAVVQLPVPVVCLQRLRATVSCDACCKTLGRDGSDCLLWSPMTAILDQIDQTCSWRFRSR